MKRMRSHLIFAVVALLFIAMLVYVMCCRQGTVVDIEDMMPVDSTEIERVMQDSLDRVYSDSLTRVYKPEYKLMDTIVCMSEAIREKKNPDYSGFYWKWLRDCNMQIGRYLRVKGMYRGRLYASDTMAAIDSVDRFVDLYLSGHDTQGDMNACSGVHWVIQFLRTMEYYQLVYNRRSDAAYRRAVYRDYRHWFWTSETFSYFFYEVLQGGDQYSGTMSPGEVAWASNYFCLMQRYWLNEELKMLDGKKSRIMDRYQTVAATDFAKEKQRYMRREQRGWDDAFDKKREGARIAAACDSLTHVFDRWMCCRDNLELTIRDRQLSAAFHNSTRRIRWYMYQLWQKDMEVRSVMPELDHNS